jgi:hypothetical protein
MESYSDIYKKHLESLTALEKSIMDSIVIAIKTISVEPLKIGNMVYYYVEDNGVEVPAYCYRVEYGRALSEHKEPTFLPIYDFQGFGEYGWQDFSECCRIFDVIRNKLIS